jgi:hypothetical protein
MADRSPIPLTLEAEWRTVENQAQRRRTVTAGTAVGRIRVNGIRPVSTYGGRVAGGNRRRTSRGPDRWEPSPAGCFWTAGSVRTGFGWLRESS